MRPHVAAAGPAAAAADAARALPNRATSANRAAETRTAGERNGLSRREPGRRPRQEAAVHFGQLVAFRSAEPRVLDVLLVKGRHVFVAEACDRHVQDVLGEDPMRIRLAFGGDL